MIKFEFYGNIKDGTLKIRNRKTFDAVVRGLENKEIQLTIERKYRKRSNQMNRFFHGPIISIIQQGLLDAGFNEARSKQWVKDLIKYKFLRSEAVSETTGEVIDVIQGTSDLTTTEMSELWLDIRLWAREFLNVEIPDPGQIEMTY